MSAAYVRIVEAAKARLLEVAKTQPEGSIPEIEDLVDWGKRFALALVRNL